MPSTDWKETVAPGEEAALERLAETLVGLQRAHAARHGTTARALHAKGHVGVEARFEVLDGLADHLRQGLFAQPGEHRAYVRFSNGSGRRQKDGVGDVRGVGIKVLGVEGKKIIPGLEDAVTQDFLLIGSTTTPFENAEEFVALVVAASGSPLLLLPRLAGAMGWGRAFRAVKKLLGEINQPFPTFAGRRLYTVLPFRFGPYAARAAILPTAELAPEQRASRGSGPDALADDLAVRLAEGPLAWDFAVQLYVDERTPIEDPTVDWPEHVAPWERVARLTLPKQDVRSVEGRALGARIEAMSFDPWHALVEHRPLGQMMRARNHAYRLSTQARGASPEPTG
ncbi:MAG: catalase [Myxococcales bacterium]|nr:catalase [Myxococcales bacterium]